MANRTCCLPDCDKAHRARGYCSTHYNAVVLGERKRHPREMRACIVCATPVVRRRDNQHKPTCSVHCRYVVTWGEVVAPTSGYQWRRDAVMRARKAGVHVVEMFEREDVFERDQWTCQDCRVRCGQPNPFDLRAATIDHVIPLTAGGEHSRRNAQTLCLSCNSAKQARISPAA